MKFFDRSKGKSQFQVARPGSMGDLRFISTAALERELDGSKATFATYFFAIYHCSPDEPAGINARREELRQTFPTKSIRVGEYFVLSGEPAFLALAAYYQALVGDQTSTDDFRAYASQRLDEIVKAHQASQSLPVPIDLTEGQLSQDRRLEFLTCIAISNGQVVPRTGE